MNKNNFHKISSDSAVDFLCLYLSGYYPYYDHKSLDFYWTKEESRTFIDLRKDSALKNAEKMLKKTSDNFIIRKNNNPSLVIEYLAREDIKEKSWVHGQVIDVYTKLLGHNFLVTIEAWHHDPETGREELVGGLLGIDLHGAFLAETMFSITPGASKRCLCYLVINLKEMGYGFIDVQVQHDKGHPSRKIGEDTIPFFDYVMLLRDYAYAKKAR